MDADGFGGLNPFSYVRALFFFEETKDFFLAFVA